MSATGNKKWVISWWAVLTRFFVLAAVGAAPGVYLLMAQTSVSAWKVEKVVKQSGGWGNANQERKEVVYITEDAIRMENKDGITIIKVEGDSAVFLRIFPDRKQYMVLSPRWLVMGMFWTFVECDTQGTECHVDTTVVQPTNEYQTIRGYRARKVIVQMKMMGMLKMPATQWMTKDWEALREAMRAYREVLRKVFLTEERSGKLIGDVLDYMDEIAEKYGEVIHSEVTMMGGNSVTEVVAVDHVRVSRDLFRVPSGYQRQENPFSRGPQR